MLDIVQTGHPVKRREREEPRFSPRTYVTVGLQESGYPVAYGLVKNISDSGLCLVTDEALILNSTFVFRLSFFNEGIMDVAGRVVWCSQSDLPTNSQKPGDQLIRPLGDRWFKAMKMNSITEAEALSGVMFTGLSTGERKKVLQLL